VITSSARGRLRLGQAFLRDIRSPEWGLAGQGARFGLVAALVGSTYALVTLLLHDVLLVPFEIALAIGFAVGVLLHFTLQRVFVWRHHEQFALPMGHQALRYLPMCAVQYGLTALSTSELPALLHLPVEAVYPPTVLAVASLNFLIFRGYVFHVAGRGPNRDAMS
jgi:putative flippase GtrA